MTDSVAYEVPLYQRQVPLYQRHVVQMPDTGGDYGRGDGDARVNRAPPPAQGMTASKDEVEEVLPPKEVMDTLGRDVVGHWETVPGTHWIGCIPIKVDAKVNIYAPTGDSDVYLDETEADVTFCFCNKMHQCSTGRSSGGLHREEIGLAESKLRLSDRIVDYTRDEVGSQLLTYQVNGVDYGGNQTSRQTTFRFSNFGDATMTSVTTKPIAFKVDFKRVSRIPKPLSDRFLRKKELPPLPPVPPVTPPSVQVIRRTPGKVSRKEAVAYAETVLPIHGGHAAGCKVCFYGPCQIPCPACIYVIPCRTGEPRDEPGCICPIIFCFGAPLPSIVCSCERGPGESWIFRGDKGAEDCQCIVVDKEEGIINCYPSAGCFGHCSLVPIAKVGQLSVCK